MDQLPEELIALVCEHCDHASLKNARLVNKPFKASADPLVFEHFYMGLFGYGLCGLLRPITVWHVDAVYW